MRVIIYTGKGGVGKTSVAASTALKCAERGYRTIIMSTDAAHSLGDAFDTPLSGDAKEILPNLWAQEVDVLQEVDVYWGTVKRWLIMALAWQGLEEFMAEEVAILPGMEELAGLLYILLHHDSGQFDTIIVDCAPTGETLRLLSFPEVLRWWMERLYPIERRAAAVLRPIIRPFMNIPIPEDEVFVAVKDIFVRLDRMRTILTDPAKTSVRLVLNPEKMVIKEAQRTFTYLNLYGYHTDLIICNRILPKEITDPYFASWRQTQARYEEAIKEGFSPLPIRGVPLMNQEVVGVPMLHQMGEAIFGQEDPTQMFFQGKSREITKEDGYYVLVLPLPFATKENISLSRVGDELVVHVGNQKRNIVLPHALAGLSPKDAQFEGDRLKIRFAVDKD